MDLLCSRGSSCRSMIEYSTLATKRCVSNKQITLILPKLYLLKQVDGYKSKEKLSFDDQEINYTLQSKNAGSPTYLLRYSVPP